MSHQRRCARVAEQIKREVSQMLHHGIKDDRVDMGMTSITEVDVSRDLRYARIYVSIYGTERDRLQTMAGLESATGFVRRELAKRLTLRFVPEISFAEDKSLERGTQVLALINRLAEERSAKEQTDSV